MCQRRISEEEISMILELGEWNARADRLVLSGDACAREERALRKEIAELERKAEKQREQRGNEA
jgi:hypothetical protein